MTGAFDPQYIDPANLFTPSRSWRLTFTLQQPIFDGGARRAAKALRQVSVTQDQLTFDLHKIQARSDVRLSAASVASYQRALANARTAVDQANEVLQITTQAFQVGATTNLDVIDAERTARDAGHGRHASRRQRPPGEAAAAGRVGKIPEIAPRASGLTAEGLRQGPRASRGLRHLKGVGPRPCAALSRRLKA